MLYKHALPFLIALLSLSFGMVLWLAYQAPLFVDDAHWLIQNSRIIHDGFKIINLYPQCTGNFVQGIPWPLIPGRAFAALFHPDTLIGIRYLGLVKYLLSIGCIAFIIWLLFDKKLPYVLALGGVTALLSLGSLPIIMTLDRPETSIILGICLMILAALAGSRTQSAPHLALTACLYICVLSWLFSTHPKAQSLIPAALVAACVFNISNRHLRMAFIAGVAILSISSVMLWKNHTSCADYPKVEQRLGWHSVIPKDFTNNPTAATGQIIENIQSSYQNYSPAWQTTASYLGFFTVDDVSTVPLPFYKLANAINTIIIAGIVMFLITGSGRCLLQHNRRAMLWSLLAWCILMPALLVILTLKHSHMKEGGLIVATLLLSGMLLLWLNKWQEKHLGLAKRICIILIPISIVNHGLFAAQWHSLFEHTATPAPAEHGYFSNDSRFQTIFDSRERNLSIIKAAEACSISTSAASHLVVDDYTYMPFKNTFQPFYGRTLFLWGVPDNDYIAFLNRTQSDGVVTLCQSLPKPLRMLATENDGICCISKQTLQQGHR